MTGCDGGIEGSGVVTAGEIFSDGTTGGSDGIVVEIGEGPQPTIEVITINPNKTARTFNISRCILTPSTLKTY
jgi:hypothetical protein